ncbi:unnamed protein product [Protopolystoma xenopodis]|uniref:Uncharacterized protein n=1 Tax=Protopolystoma xenopodis TaxID=117903 RepID=A0A3S5A7V1_9PLAT|nr:unnamed protein product [Protopolystoma xenopodis]
MIRRYLTAPARFACDPVQAGRAQNMYWIPYFEAKMSATSNNSPVPHFTDAGISTTTENSRSADESMLLNQKMESNDAIETANGPKERITFCRISTDLLFLSCVF